MKVHRLAQGVGIHRCPINTGLAKETKYNWEAGIVGLESGETRGKALLEEKAYT